MIADTVYAGFPRFRTTILPVHFYFLAINFKIGYDKW